ncbi:MAG: hypothetical protein NTX50_30345 [Candidatus Sumerlaeota bacterium]|nr:hypothetical protein [Candidatus Sumerlaeota bacterium]
MKTNDLLKDPVFHLNLLLWMAKEQPSKNYRVRPLFYQAGFEIVYIEQPFAFTVQTAAAVQKSELSISLEPEPEMILGRLRDLKAVYFEAKANSFSPDSTTAKQARGHLLACGPDFGEVLAPLESCRLCYLLPEDKREAMSECLRTLTDQLKQKSLKPGIFSTHGLSVHDGNLIYSWDEEFQAYTGLQGTQTDVMSGMTADVNPDPLILLFSDEDHHDPLMQDYYRNVVIQQVRACLLCELHAHQIGAIYSRTADQILAQTSGGFFQYYGRERQKSLSRLIKQNVFRRIDKDWKERQRGIVLSEDELQICWGVSGEKEEFLNWLEDRRTRFGTSKSQPETIESEQMDLLKLAKDKSEEV